MGVVVLTAHLPIHRTFSRLQPSNDPRAGCRFKPDPGYHSRTEITRLSRRAETSMSRRLSILLLPLFTAPVIAGGA